MKSRCIKKLKWLGLFVVLLLSQATVYAAYYLPASSLWQGSRYYDKNNVSAYVEYAVYDTQAANYHNTLNGLIDGFPTIGSGRYIYAYQAFDLGSSLPPIATFELLGGSPSEASGIGSYPDGNSGLTPSNDGTSFLWTFTNGAFVYNKHSAFMVFSSDGGPIAGDFKLSTEYGQEPPVNGDVPEPATIALLAVGAFGFIRKNK
jgi:hypothetical protein